MEELIRLGLTRDEAQEIVSLIRSGDIGTAYSLVKSYPKGQQLQSVITILSHRL